MKTIFLHGLGQTPRDWNETIAASNLTAVEAPMLFPKYGAVTYPRLLAALERSYMSDSEPLHLCGLSLGAMMALDYALRHPLQVAKLTLIGMPVKSPTHLIDVQNIFFRLMPNRTFTEMGLAKEAVIELAHSMRSLDFSERLQEVQCPVTVVCGAKDRANRHAARTLAKELPNACLHIVPGAGHEVNKDAPETLAQLLP